MLIATKLLVAPARGQNTSGDGVGALCKYIAGPWPAHAVVFMPHCAACVYSEPTLPPIGPRVALLLEMGVCDDEVALPECGQVAGEQRAPKRRRRECFIIMEQGGADGVT